MRFYIGRVKFFIKLVSEIFIENWVINDYLYKWKFLYKNKYFESGKWCYFWMKFLIDFFFDDL